MGDEKDPENVRKEDNDERGGGGQRWLGDVMKEITMTGLATLFMTEDSVRGFLKDKKLPKELLAGLLDGVGKKKDDFYGLVAKEVGRVLSKIDITREVSRFLEQHNVQFEAKISFEPKTRSSGEETAAVEKAGEKKA
jgi:hypothetical protein